ncbi:PREDICTED: endoplasmic reticulum membrane-associated RNA degradation protein-like isoform X3 [Priapulus caudatus]|uniref:Endoplasmic reticulum membrane-associated RNA degradation protein-like isoform X3 n=1 Tax=Priapulus caudatus TaxID=37621 RepID=A0ABM1EJY6_PRICU|nr:PREDICTED: endoplasmic reticulum membrane-associated RNA degradation protein-like isoform X3 [Priapulus caudatus]
MLFIGLLEVIVDCFEMLQKGAGYHTLSMLLLTAVLERALGNVYLLRGVQCPSLLNTLLSTPELVHTFGQFQMSILKVLMGPPTSLNLRNITWHGFAGPQEIPLRCVAFLILIIVSLGEVIGDVEIPQRPYIAYPHVSMYQGVLPAISHVNCQPDLWKRLVHSSCFVTPTFKPYWELALHLLQHGRHGYGLALLLPQLEHGLRRVFTTVNKCQERMLTAENTVLFTTFDEMLLPQLADGRENKLMSAIGESYMMVLFDLLVHTDGPRIRDKLSHGEINFSSLPLVLFDHVSALCLAFCSACLPSDAPLRTENGVYRLLAAIKGYESIFHPRSALVRQIKDCSGSLSTWSELCVPDDRVFDGIRCSWSNVSATEPLFRPACQAALSITQMSSTFCDGGLDKFVLPFEHIVKQTQHLLQGMTGSTLYRPKAELELIGLLRCIVQNCTALSEQLQNGLNLRFRQLQEKELRSRQRATYQRALESITSIGVGTRLALVVVCYVLDTLEHRTAADDRHKTARCLKRTLQYVENLRSMTHPTRNRWMETRALTEAFIHSFLIHDPAPISGLKSLP